MDSNTQQPAIQPNQEESEGSSIIKKDYNICLSYGGRHNFVFTIETFEDTNSNRSGNKFVMCPLWTEHYSKSWNDAKDVLDSLYAELMKDIRDFIGSKSWFLEISNSEKFLFLKNAQTLSKVVDSLTEDTTEQVDKALGGIETITFDSNLRTAA